jgi:phage FluMu protein Com
MVKIIHCVDCGRCLKIEGSVEGLRQITLDINCPYCETVNEVRWPLAAQVSHSQNEEFITGKTAKDTPPFFRASMKPKPGDISIVV